MNNYPASTITGALVRGVLRSAVLLGLATLAAWWYRDESSPGNRAFLVSLACLLVLIAIWGLAETRRELRMVRGRTSGQTH